jgi:hypothetical protein
MISDRRGSVVNMRPGPVVTGMTALSGGNVTLLIA